MSEEAAVETPAVDAGWVSGDGTFGEGAPEEVQSLMTNNGYKNVMDVVNDLAGLKKFKGVGEHLVIPEAEDAEGWNGIFNKLGRPETHDKYEFTNETDLEMSDELIGQFKEFAHGLGLSQKQFRDVIQFEMDAAQSQMESYAALEEKGKEQNLATLAEKYGEANVVTKLTNARSIAEKLGIYKTLEAKNLASDVDVIDMLVAIDAKTAEDSITPPGTPPSTDTPQEELEKLMKSEAWLQKFHKDHKKAQARYIELNQIVVRSRR